MDRKLIRVTQIKNLSKALHTKQQTIVLAGGCFDVLHPGHIQFLTKAKESGDVLILLLENDEYMKKYKGEGRPIHTQDERAFVLSALSTVDYIVPLPHIYTDAEYDELVIQLKPAIIATTAGDAYLRHKQRQAEIVGATVKTVTEKISDHSTTRIAKLLTHEL